eukprot:CAMPEP_0119034474 /NCGR_PEP_ID=MMETSP1177-20130426/1462_1 /TAXON_ID=2985 /ORGANISM="Ochromonas sp, Strain CCMP1899" /LENGTH=284 /DNA_ID=CAMNT_0006991929 /DNA_START=180 /DNA_END=1031 /DNA_ORIENTATION=-
MEKRIKFMSVMCIFLSLSLICYSENGQSTQVVFAMKAANRNERRCIGLSCLDGSALISARKTDKSDKHSHISSDGRDTAIDDNDIEKKYFKSTRILSSETKELYKIDQALYAGLIGIPADCRHVLKYLKKQAQEYRSNFGEQIPMNKLGDKMSSYFNALTMSSDTRPLAVSLILGSTGENSGGGVMKITCDGNYNLYHGCSTDTENEEEDKALLLRMKDTQWSKMTVEEAITAMRHILTTLEVPQDDDGSSDEDYSKAVSHNSDDVKAQKMKLCPYEILEYKKW